jgi:exosortase/archaeosortase family protein
LSTSLGALTAFIYLLLIANAMPPFVAEAVALRGWFGALFNLFDISAIVWLGVAAALALALRENRQPSKRDWTIATAFTLIALVPASPLSGAALTAAALWGWLSSPAGASGRRPAAIVLSLSAFFFWGRLALAIGSEPLLSADAAFVSWISGLPASGNVVGFPDGAGFTIAPGCSSLHGISLVLVLWTTVVSWFDLRPDRQMLATLFAAIAVSIAVNGLRLAMIGWNPEQFDYWHVGNGALMFGWLALIVTTAIIYIGFQRHLRAV